MISFGEPLPHCVIFISTMNSFLPVAFGFMERHDYGCAVKGFPTYKMSIPGAAFFSSFAESLLVYFTPLCWKAISISMFYY